MKEPLLYTAPPYKMHRQSMTASVSPPVTTKEQHASKKARKEREWDNSSTARACDITCSLNEESARATHTTATTATHVVRARRAQASDEWLVLVR